MSTRDRILESAEILFASGGYDGTSLRDITERAGVNVASVNYHFGSKEQLLVELLDRIVAPMNAERLALLKELTVPGTTPEVAEILTAFLLPDLNALFRLRSRNPTLPRFVSRMYSEGSPLMQEVIGAQFAEVGREFGQAFAVALPDLDKDEIAFRLSCVVGIVVYMFAGNDAPGMVPLAGNDIDSDLRRLLTITEGIMTAEIREGVANS